MPDHPPVSPRRIEYRPLEGVVPADRNPKKHADDELQASIRRHGFTEPVLEDGRTGKLVAGHGRLENLAIMARAGEPMPEGLLFQDDGWWLPIIIGWSSKDDAEAEDYIALSNRLTELGGWDADLLASMYGDPDRDITGTGFTRPALDDLLAALDTPIELPEAGTDADFADLPPARKGEPPPPRTAQGLREVVLTLALPQHQEYLDNVARLRRAWGEDVTSLLLLRALQEAVDRIEP